jgi:hypothetical protein
MDGSYIWSDNIEEWTKRVRKDGKWFEPRWWFDKYYLTRSPYSQEEIEVAFQRLQDVYSPKVFLDLLREIKESKAAWWDFWYLNQVPRWLINRQQSTASDANSLGLDVAGLMGLGLDLAIAWGGSQPLTSRLQTHTDYWGARWELSVKAALTREEVSFAYEPLRGCLNTPNPDFLIPPGETGIFWECKAPKMSQRMIKDCFLSDRLREGITERLQPEPQCLVELDPSPKLNSELKADVGRSQFIEGLDEVCKEIAELIKATVAAGNLPVNQTIKGIHCKVSCAENPTMKVTGFEFDQEREAHRIMQKTVIEADGQIPPGRLGVCLVALNMFSAPSQAAAHLISCFKGELQNEGSRLIGVVFSFDSLSPPIKRVVLAIHNPNIQIGIQRSVLEALYRGLNYHRDRLQP